jgi:hypothetical protein
MPAANNPAPKIQAREAFRRFIHLLFMVKHLGHQYRTSARQPAFLLFPSAHRTMAHRNFVLRPPPVTFHLLTLKERNRPWQTASL